MAQVAVRGDLGQRLLEDALEECDIEQVLLNQVSDLLRLLLQLEGGGLGYFSLLGYLDAGVRIKANHQVPEERLGEQRANPRTEPGERVVLGALDAEDRAHRRGVGLKRLLKPGDAIHQQMRFAGTVVAFHLNNHRLAFLAVLCKLADKGDNQTFATSDRVSWHRSLAQRAGSLAETGDGIVGEGIIVSHRGPFSS